MLDSVAGPVRGRLADRHEPRRVLLVLLAGHPFAWVFGVLLAGFGVGTTVAGLLVGDGAPAGARYAAACPQLLVAWSLWP